MGINILTFEAVQLAIIAVLAVWCIAALLIAHPTLRDKIDQSHLGTFVPVYTFFAPKPSEVDFHLLYREKLDDESVTDWTECRNVSSKAARWQWLWAPRMNDIKAIYDMTRTVERQFSDDDSEESTGDASTETDDDDLPGRLKPVDFEDEVLSPAYMAMLNYISNRDLDDDAVEVQWLVMQGTLRTDKKEPVIISNFHEVEA